MATQYHITLPKREALTAEDFMISGSNQEAALWIMEREPSAWGAPCLILSGPEGCGKTHLLHIWTEKYKARSLALQEEAVLDVLEEETRPAALALDDAQRLAGDKLAEEWMQHLYNAAQSTQTPLLLTASLPPSAWAFTLPDIASRLKSCPVIQIHEPDDELMLGMLMKQFSDRQLLVEAGVVDYLAQRLERTGTAIRNAVDLLDRKALEEGKKISVPFTQRVLSAEQAKTQKQ